MLRVRLPHNINPYPWQRPIIGNHQLGKDVWLNIHRRGGKDLTSFAGIAIPEAAEIPGTYHYIFPLLNQGRDAIWEGKDHKGNDILEHYVPKELVLHRDNADMKLTIRSSDSKTSVIQIFGVNNGQYEKLRGKPANGVVLSEASRMEKKVLEVINPMLIATKGWKVVQSTPNGQNWYYDAFYLAMKNTTRNFCMTATIDDTYDHNGNPIVTREMVEAQIADGIMTEDEAQQEYWCSFQQGIEGTYIGKQMQEIEDNGRIEYLPYDPNYLVDTYWDLGVGDPVAIWFVQQVGQEIRFIDFEEASGTTFTYWARILQEKGYLYRKHYAPFDILNREGVGKEETAKSRLAHAKDVGIIFHVTPRASFENGLLAIRGLLGLCRFDEKNCREGIRHLKLWGKVYNKLEQRYTETEKHDIHSHAGAAARYAAINIRQAQGFDVLKTREEKHFKNVFRRKRSYGSAMSV
ncbi:MAG: hypothetical protein WC319_03685 [Candidatus Paceibacterota bacterium]|jgi:hypothetical protein